VDKRSGTNRHDRALSGLSDTVGRMTAEPDRKQYRSVGSLLRALRERHRLTLDQLSERTAVAPAQLCRYERGAVEPSIATPSTSAIVRLSEVMPLSTLVRLDFAPWLERREVPVVTLAELITSDALGPTARAARGADGPETKR
jgi:transcriptional regulator with XRE-family HTH domain